MALSTKERILLGGLGALTPIVLNLVIVDFETLVAQFTVLKAIGYLVKILVLFGVGGLVGYLHQSEKVPFKLVQLGVGAPALLLALANGTNVQSPSVADPRAHQTSTFSIISEAHAQTTPKARVYALPELSGARQFWHGLTGRAVADVWFVIADDNLDLPAAEAKLNALRSTHPDLNPQLYFMYGQANRYAVVIGENLEEPAALALAQSVQANPDLRTAKVWKLPSRQ